MSSRSRSSSFTIAQVSRMRCALAVVALLGFVSCTSSTEPNIYLAEMTDIEVPETVGVDDPVVISFTFGEGGCERLERVQAEQRHGELTFAVWLRRPTTQGCFGVIYERTVQYTIVPLTPLPLTVTFRQPTGDVVYTVAASAGNDASAVVARLTPQVVAP